MFFRKRDKPEVIDILKGYNQWAENYSKEQNPIKTASNETIKKLLPNLKGKRVVDAGCGTGYFCEFAEQAGASKITGIDFSTTMIEQAKKSCKFTEFMVDDIQQATLQDSSADIIISALVLGHIKEIEPIIIKFSKALTKDGTLVISDFHPFLSLRGQKRTFMLNKKLYEVPHHVHMIHTYINLLSQSDFRVETMEEPVWQSNPVIFVLKANKI